MNREEYWSEFMKTGRIDSYLKYKGVSLNRELPKREEITNAVSDRGTDNQGPQYWG